MCVNHGRIVASFAGNAQVESSSDATHRLGLYVSNYADELHGALPNQTPTTTIPVSIYEVKHGDLHEFVTGFIAP